MTIKHPETIDQLWSRAKMGYKEPVIDFDIVTEFANLIAKECAYMAKKSDPELAKQIKERFGVE